MGYFFNRRKTLFLEDGKDLSDYQEISGGTIVLDVRIAVVEEITGRVKYKWTKFAKYGGNRRKNHANK